jgi:multiple sugar transport system permease protein
MPLAGGNNLIGRGGIGLIDSHLGLLLPYIAGAFGVFMFRQFFLNFPRALDDAARIDGLGRFRTFYKIYIPLSSPVFVTLLLLKSTQVWNDYTWPLIILTTEKLFTVQLALSNFQADINITLWNLLMAATTIIVVPLIVTFVFVQKQFIRGIATTGIKG